MPHSLEAEEVRDALFCSFDGGSAGASVVRSGSLCGSGHDYGRSRQHPEAGSRGRPRPCRLHGHQPVFRQDHDQQCCRGLSFLSGKDPVTGGKDADELFAAEIVFDFCSGATLLNTNTCTFREAFLTRDAKPDTDVDTAQWLIGAAVRFHVDDNQQGDLKVGSFRVDVTDAPVPESSTLSLCILAMLCIAVLALRRRGAGRGVRLFGSGSS